MSSTDELFHKAFRHRQRIRNEYSPQSNYDLFSCPNDCLSCCTIYEHTDLAKFFTLNCPLCCSQWIICSSCTTMRKPITTEAGMRKHLSRYHSNIDIGGKNGLKSYSIFDKLDDVSLSGFENEYQSDLVLEDDLKNTNVYGINELSYDGGGLSNKYDEPSKNEKTDCNERISDDNSTNVSTTDDSVSTIFRISDKASPGLNEIGLDIDNSRLECVNNNNYQFFKRDIRNKGGAYLVAQSQFSLPDIYDRLDDNEVIMHLKIAYLCFNCCKSILDDICSILKNINLMYDIDRTAISRTWQTQLPMSYKDLREVVMYYEKSIWKKLPGCNPVIIEGHAYFSI